MDPTFDIEHDNSLVLLIDMQERFVKHVVRKLS